ncbi:phage tail tape measure protein [Candidatus Saccharibacteria bacterium]|nr:phage tail tape measure protein [Candidatus Saccharibacteria bacterium]
MATKALSIELLLESKAFTAQMQKVNDSFKNTNKNLQAFGANLQKVGASMAAVGASITAAFGVAVKSLANAADVADDTAKRTGLTVEAVQELAYAAKLCGTDLGTMEIALRTVQKNMAGTGQESATFKAALEGLGISLKDLQQMSPQEQFDTLSQAIAGVVDPSQRAGLAMAVFGRSGTALLPMLAEGADGIARLKQEAHQFGYVMDQETAKAGSDFNDNLDRLKGSVGGLAQQIVAGMLPGLNTFVRAMAEVVSGIKDWVSAHPGLTKALAWVAAGVGGILTVFGSLVAACGTFIALAPAIGAAFTVATGPVGVTVMAIAGLVTGIIALYKNWDTVSHYLMQTWRVLTALVLKAVEMQLAALEKLIGWVPKVGTAVQSALQKVKDLQTSTWESIGNSQLEYEKKKNEQSVRNAQETEQKKAAVMVSTNAAAMEQVKTDTNKAHEELKAKHDGFWSYLYEASNAQSLNVSKTVSDVYSSLQSNLSTSFQDLFAQIGNGWKGLTDIAVNFARSMYNSLTQILANLAAEEIKNIIAVQIAQRAAAKANIAASAAEAGAKAAASSAGWALWGAVAIGAGILAAVLAFADGFATGGIVGGNSFTGDKVLTRVNSGEMILNEAQQARLFAIADGRESAGNGGAVTINQNITVQNGNDIEAITQAIKRGSIEALEMANVAYKAGQKQNKYVG